MGRRGSEILVSVVLAAVTVAVFQHVRDNGFIDYDDIFFVTGNPNVRAGLTRESLAWAWTALDGFWHPLTWMSLQLDYQLYHDRPAGYHLTNLALHAANVVLLFRVLRRM